MVVQSDDRVRIDDVLQEVLEVGITAGQMRSDLAAGAEELVAGSARGAEEIAAAFDVGAQDGVRAEELLVVGDGLGLGFGAGVDGAPVLLEPSVHLGVIEAADLAGQRGAQDGLAEFTGIDGGEQSTGAFGATGEVIEGERTDAFVFIDDELDQERGDARVVELSERDDRRSAQSAGLGEVEDGRERFHVADLGQVSEDAGALRHRCLGVEERGAQLIQGRGVAEGDGDLAGAAADLVGGMFGERSVDLGPGGGLLEADLSDEAVLDAVEQGGAEFVVRGEQGLAQDFELFALGARFDRRVGQTTRGEVSEFGEGGLLGEGESAGRIGGDSGFEGIPDQERDVLVSHVFGILREGFEPAPAVRHRQPLGGGGDTTTHDGGRVLLAELDDTFE